MADISSFHDELLEVIWVAKGSAPRWVVRDHPRLVTGLAGSG
jgi:hypothetical protein